MNEQKTIPVSILLLGLAAAFAAMLFCGAVLNRLHDAHVEATRPPTAAEERAFILEEVNRIREQGH